MLATTRRWGKWIYPHARGFPPGVGGSDAVDADLRNTSKLKTRNRRGVDIVATKVTAATVPKPGVASSRSAFERELRENETYIIRLFFYGFFLYGGSASELRVLIVVRSRSKCQRQRPDPAKNIRTTVEMSS